MAPRELRLAFVKKVNIALDRCCLYFLQAALARGGSKYGVIKKFEESGGYMLEAKHKLQSL